MSKTIAGEGGAFPSDWLASDARRARALVDEAGTRAVDLVSAWIAGKNAAAVSAIASADDAPALARKAARRGVNVLKSRGVAIPERPRAAAARAEGPVIEAWFRPPDGAGTSAFTIGARSKDGRYRLADVIVQEGAGLVSIAGMQMSRSQLKQTFDGIAGRFGAPPAPVPLAWARARIAAALVDNAKSGKPVPLGVDSHGDLLGPAPSHAPLHPAKELAAGPLGSNDLERTAKLHAEPELRAWLPDPPAMQKMLLAIGQNVSAEAGLDPDLARGKVTEIIERATDEFFSVDARARVAERMHDAAISMAARGADDQAVLTVGAALSILGLAESTPPHTVPFLRAFFEKAFGLATARAAARQRSP